MFLLEQMWQCLKALTAFFLRAAEYIKEEAGKKKKTTQEIIKGGQIRIRKKDEEREREEDKIKEK